MYTTTRRDSEFEHAILERIGKSWDTRVAVRKERIDLTQYCDPTIPDFPISMVPFWDDPDFATLSNEAKMRFLGTAWVAYNEKAIFLEDEIIQPACKILLQNKLPGASDPHLKQVLAQIQVDEQFHILMCLDVCNNARVRHGVEDFVAPEPLVGGFLHKAVEEADGQAEAGVVRVVYASIAEMSINAYLKQVSKDMTIQPLNRINTDMHRRDELTHGVAFREIVGSVYRSLSPSLQVCFRNNASRALRDITRPDHSQWEAILEYLKIPNRQAIIARLEEAMQGKLQHRDYTVLRGLFNDLGIKNDIDFLFETP